MDKPY
ncbi:hypothetical protein D049_3828A, partial [Vibrio parahaemolyticus VPTS-2010]